MVRHELVVPPVAATGAARHGDERRGGQHVVRRADLHRGPEVGRNGQVRYLPDVKFPSSAVTNNQRCRQ